jgi:hypothetical protein
MSFHRAERKKAKARIGLCGPAGSGKTLSALKLAFGMGGKIAVIDTEHGSAELYSEHGEYDVAAITPPYTVEKYRQLIKDAEEAGYEVLVIDSLTHAWAGEGGLLDEKERIPGNSYAAWRKITPKHNALIDAMLQSPCHIIATMRSKTEYVLEENEKGRSVPRKVGMAPVQREGMDYEFTIVFDIDQGKHVATTSKDRTDLFNGFCDVLKEDHGKRIAEWLEGGAEDKTAIHKANGAAIKGEIDGVFTKDEVDGVLLNRKQWIDDMPQDFQDYINRLADAKRQELTPAA